MSIKFRSVRIYLVIPVLILGICSMVSLAMTGVSLRSVSNVSKNIAQKQINSVSCLDAVKSNVIEMQKEVMSYCLITQDSQRESVVKNITELKNDTESYLKKLNTMLQSDELEKQLDTLDANYRTYEKKVNEIREIASTDAMTALEDANRTLGKYGTAVESMADQMIASNDKITKSQVRDLIDSLYNGYPTGYIITWKNPDVHTKDGTMANGKHILIDGQQRITALMASIVGLEVLDEDFKKDRQRAWCYYR
mgnify:CR=1 FL=1